MTLLVWLALLGATLPFTEGKMAEGVVNLSPQTPDVYLAKFAFQANLQGLHFIQIVSKIHSAYRSCLFLCSRICTNDDFRPRS
jgi:hypothetical protein